MKQKHLIILFVVLLGIFLINKYAFKDRKEKTFDTELISVDTAKVDAVYIYPKSFNHKEIILKKENGKWRLKYDDKNVSAGSSTVQSILAQINNLTANRLVSKTSKNWEKYEINDSLGTRVKIEQEGELLGDLTIGKFNYNSNRFESR